jgi:putative PIN family toxin of toxin-antitoxin system
MRIVCDTNVLVSGVLFAGPPRQVLQMIVSGSVTNVTSTALLREAEDVLGRVKFGLTPDQVGDIVALFRETFEIAHSTRHVRAVPKDPDDNAVIEAAIAGRCDVIVSGDSHLQDVGRWGTIRILSPARFVAEVEALRGGSAHG